MSILHFAQWLQETPISVSIRESILMFPLLEGGHLLGISVSAGTIAISDLRMMGLIFKKESASDVFHQLIPWTTRRIPDDDHHRDSAADGPSRSSATTAPGSA